MKNYNLNPAPFRLSNFIASVSENAGVHHLYKKYKDRKTDNQHLTMNIKQGFDSCLQGIQSLDRIENYLKDDMVLFFGSNIPQKLQQSSVSASLSQNKNSYLFASCFTSIEIITVRYKLLRKLLGETVIQDLKEANHKDSIKKSIRIQINTLKKELAILAETNLQLMKSLRSEYLNSEIRQMRQSLINVTNKKCFIS